MGPNRTAARSNSVEIEDPPKKLGKKQARSSKEKFKFRYFRAKNGPARKRGILRIVRLP